VVGAALVLAGLVATGVVIAGHCSSLASQSGPLTSLRSTPATAGAAIPPALVASLGTTTSLTHRAFLARTIIVRLDPRAGVVSSITGAPARVLMDPTTGTVLSIRHVEGASSA
jgi:hypothetical protein